MLYVSITINGKTLEYECHLPLGQLKWCSDDDVIHATDVVVQADSPELSAIYRSFCFKPVVSLDGQVLNRVTWTGDMAKFILLNFKRCQ